MGPRGGFDVFLPSTYGATAPSEPWPASKVLQPRIYFPYSQVVFCLSVIGHL